MNNAIRASIANRTTIAMSQLVKRLEGDLPADSSMATVPLEVPTAMRALPVPALRGWL